MKNILLLLVALLTVNTINLRAEDPEAIGKPDAELTKKQAELRIADFNAKVQELMRTEQGLDEEIQNKKNELGNFVAELNDCNKALYSLIGANEADVESFKQKLGVLEGRVRSMSNLSNDELYARVNEVKAIEAEYMELRGNKIAVLPEFYDRMVKLGRDIKNLYKEPSVKRYIVKSWAENRDCLWNIAGNIENYGDPFMWPKIWQANTDQIRNPDIIYPGQELIIPVKSPKTDDEIKAERKYFRKKRAAAAARAAARAAAEKENAEQPAKREAGL